MATGDEDVGFKKPPRKHRFKKGQSGNPKGRPKRSTNLHEILFDELDREIALTRGGETAKVSIREAIVKNLIAGAIKGNLRCFKIILRYMPAETSAVRFARVERRRTEEKKTHD